ADQNRFPELGGLQNIVSAARNERSPHKCQISEGIERRKLSDTVEQQHTTAEWGRTPGRSPTKTNTRIAQYFRDSIETFRMTQRQNNQRQPEFAEYPLDT